MRTKKTEEQKRIERESDVILAHCDAISAAILAGKSSEEIERMAIAMPLWPKTARTAVMMMGKKQFLKKGYDRTKADAEWGEGWIDEVEAERRELTGMAE